MRERLVWRWHEHWPSYQDVEAYMVLPVVRNQLIQDLKSKDGFKYKKILETNSGENYKKCFPVDE